MREYVSPGSASLLHVTDESLVQLFSTIFFAGLDTHEGEHNPISVVFLGHSSLDFVMAEGPPTEAPSLYRWKIMRFAAPRPFESRELVKLAVAGSDRRIFSSVGIIDDGRLAVTGLAREGVNEGRDPYFSIVASRPGCLSIRSGRDFAIEYERGVIVRIGDDDVFSAAPVRHALESIARDAGMDEDVVPHYLEAIVFLVREIVAHGRGGILIVSPEEHPAVEEPAPYRMVQDTSLVALLRVAWRIREKRFGVLLRNAFLAEAERIVEEFGRLTAIDGAVLLNRALALVAFGVILPVRQDVSVIDAAGARDGQGRPVDFGIRGTRHRASATFAAEHPGSVVFVASEDGQVSCLLRAPHDASVRMWRLMTEPGGAAAS